MYNGNLQLLLYLYNQIYISLIQFSYEFTAKKKILIEHGEAKFLNW